MNRKRYYHCSPRIGDMRIPGSKSALVSLLIFFLSGWVTSAGATNVLDKLPGDKVYVNTGGGYTLSTNSDLTYTVLTVASLKSSPGTVSVNRTSNASISGELHIPSVIYVKVSGLYYRYNVTEVVDHAFENQTGITNVFFTKDPFYGYEVTTIGANAFAGTTGLKGTVQLPRTITSIGAYAFGVSTSTTLADVVIGANSTEPTPLTIAADAFKNRTITNLHILGNFGSYISAGAELFSKANVTNVCYYGDGKGESYYEFLTALTEKGYHQPGQNLYLPSDQIKDFVKKCIPNHTDWIPSTVNCLTFEHKVNKVGTFTFMLASNNTKSGGPQVALHAAKLDDGVTDLTLNFNNDEWKTDLMPTETGLEPDITQIDSKAFSGNNGLRSITIIPDDGDDAVTLKGDAFSGVKTLRYIDLSQSANFKVDSSYTLSRLQTTTADTIPYKYTKSTGTYDYELTNTNPFGGLPAYTLVFLPTNIEQFSSDNSETVYKTDGTPAKTDGTPATTLTRPLDENFVFKTSDGYTCNNFGVYNVTDLDATTAPGQDYTWYSFLNPYEFTADNSKFYRQFSAGVPATVCLPFQPATGDGKFYTFKEDDGTNIVLTTVSEPAANTPYFFTPGTATTLSSSVPQTISAVTTADEKVSDSDNHLHGVYAGKSMADVSGTAYGMASKEFTYNGKNYPAGTFVKFSSKAYLNPFRAYLLFSSSRAKAAVLPMVIDDSTTGISTLPAATATDAPYYNLQGMRVATPTHGVFIHNGKKIIKK